MESPRKPTATQWGVIAVVALIVVWVVMKALAPPPFELHVRIPQGSSLSRGDEVRVAGFVVGRVDLVDVARDGRGVEAKIVIEEEYTDRIFSPPETTAVVRRGGGLMRKTYLDIVNAGDRPITAGTTLDASDAEVAVAVREASRAVQEAGGKIVESVRGILPAAMESDEAIDLKAAELMQLKEVSSEEMTAIINATKKRIQEVVDSEDGEHYRSALASISAMLDDAAKVSGSNSEAAGKLLEDAGAALARELKSVDRARLADQLDVAFTELERASIILTRLGHDVVVDLVRGPEGGTTETLSVTAP